MNEINDHLAKLGIQFTGEVKKQFNGNKPKKNHFKTTKRIV